MTSAGHVTHVAFNASTCRPRISRNLRLLFQNKTLHRVTLCFVFVWLFQTTYMGPWKTLGVCSLGQKNTKSPIQLGSKIIRSKIIRNLLENLQTVKVRGNRYIALKLPNRTSFRTKRFQNKVKNPGKIKCLFCCAPCIYPLFW